MTNQYADAAEEEAIVPDEQTSDDDGRSDEASEEVDLRVWMEEKLTALTTELRERQEYLHNSQVNFTKGQLDRLANQIASAPSSKSIAKIEAWIDDNLSPEQQQALQDRVDLKEARATKDAPRRDPDPVVVPPSGVRNPQQFFDRVIAPQLKDYANSKGITDAELSAANFMARLSAAGRPMSPVDYGDADSIAAHIAGTKAAIDRVARENAAARRSRTPVPDTSAGGARAKDYSKVNLGDISNEEYMDNRVEIALATVARNRR